MISDKLILPKQFFDQFCEQTSVENLTWGRIILKPPFIFVSELILIQCFNYYSVFFQSQWVSF